MKKGYKSKFIEPVPEDNLAEMLKTYTNRFGLQLLIILDQFEEIFSHNHAENLTTGFIEQLSQAINDSNLNANFLLSLRDDALWKLASLKPAIPYLFDNMLLLNHMNLDGAREAIEEPLNV